MAVAMLTRIYRGLSSRIRWRLGMRVAAPELEGDLEGLRQFYQSRVTDCGFLNDPGHYERPRVDWILERVSGGRLLEVGCGNGGMTQLLAPRVADVVALDTSTPSLAELARLKLPNVTPVESLVEDFAPDRGFDWIILSEVLEHLRSPLHVVRKLVQCLTPGGSLLITTPHGHWESNEHLQEFSFESFSRIVSNAEGETVSVSFLRDGAGRRRWLVGQVTAPSTPPTPDNFNSRRAIASQRRHMQA